MTSFKNSQLGHIAFIPARKGSKGFPFKNRLLFDETADFVDQKGWFDQIIVSTDDEIIAQKARERGYTFHARPEKLGGDAVSIKEVIRSVIDDLKLDKNAVLWLLYVPIVYKNLSDFLKAKEIMEQGKVASICGFIPAQSHPFQCWSYDEKREELRQYIANDVYRRQDLPRAWTHHHYICCFRAGEIENLNSELINGQTQPFFISTATAERLIEIDTPQHYEAWKSSVNKLV